MPEEPVFKPNPNCAIRTNYFGVSDAVALRRLVSSCAARQRIHVLYSDKPQPGIDSIRKQFNGQKKDALSGLRKSFSRIRKKASGKFALAYDGEIFGDPESEAGAENKLAFIKDLQSVLNEEDVIIFMDVSDERLGYPCGVAEVVSKTAVNLAILTIAACEKVISATCAADVGR